MVQRHRQYRNWLLIRNGVQTTFSVPGYALDTFPTAINDSDQIAGYFNFASDGLLRNPDGSFELFNFPAHCINNAGVIVGEGPGANDTYLYGINNLDEVVGIYIDNFGNFEAFFEGKLVYINTPEPATVWLCAFALMIAIIAARSRRSKLAR